MAEWIIEVKDGKFPIGKWTELVRCKDCKWIDLCKDPENYEYKGANGFCSKGERKESEE